EGGVLHHERVGEEIAEGRDRPAAPARRVVLEVHPAHGDGAGVAVDRTAEGVLVVGDAAGEGHVLEGDDQLAVPVEGEVPRVRGPHDRLAGASPADHHVGVVEVQVFVEHVLTGGHLDDGGDAVLVDRLSRVEGGAQRARPRGGGALVVAEVRVVAVVGGVDDDRVAGLQGAAGGGGGGDQQRAQERAG